MKLYTYGYHGGDEQRLAEIMSDPNAVLVDIRYSPYGAPGHSRQDYQIRYGRQYVHLKSLGNVNYRGDGPIALENEEEGIDRVLRGLRQGKVIVLMCACAKPDECHRTYAAHKIAQALGEPCEIIHLRKAKRDEQPTLF